MTVPHSRIGGRVNNVWQAVEVLGVGSKGSTRWRCVVQDAWGGGWHFFPPLLAAWWRRCCSRAHCCAAWSCPGVVSHIGGGGGGCVTVFGALRGRCAA